MIPVLDIGGTHVSAALVDADRARVTHRVRRPLDARGTAADILGAVVRCATELEAPEGELWGVAIPGPFDYDKGIARFEGVGKFDTLYGIDVRSVLLDTVRPRPADVLFLNDAHAFALGEWGAGAARGHRRCVGITLGTGVGSAFLADGAVRREGAGVPPQGRMDLVEHEGRGLEASVSRRAILERYGQDGVAARGLDVRDVAARARAGEKRARRVLEDTLTTLGAVLAPYIRGFDASVLVVGGAMAASWDLVGPALGSGLGDTPVRALAAELGPDAALIGAARHVAAGR
ncbi:ROK family protein [Streptomyces sp. NPDC059009]|uniref:ROK family protein n=1 Tax=Streptomyces sp. NPDC059009 TaxID=3346694 RepID=UPI00368841F7